MGFSHRGYAQSPQRRKSENVRKTSERVLGFADGGIRNTSQHTGAVVFLIRQLLAGPGSRVR